jgi:hypothetical protein
MAARPPALGSFSATARRGREKQGSPFLLMTAFLIYTEKTNLLALSHNNETQCLHSGMVVLGAIPNIH